MAPTLQTTTAATRDPRARSMVAWDCVGWAVGLATASLVRFDGDLGAIDLAPLLQATLLAVSLQAALGLALDRWAGRQIVGVVDDALRVVRLMGAVGIVVSCTAFAALIPISRFVPVTATLVAVMWALAARVTLRLACEHRTRPDVASARRVVVFGAGWGGQQIVRSMLSDATSDYLPVALIDDYPGARGRRVCGVPVRGSRHDLAEVARSTSADLLVVAIRDLDIDVMREISTHATHAGLQVKVVPALMDLMRDWIGFTDLRDLDIGDLIGRRPVDVDVSTIAGYLRGRTVLVTGAGGSIGSELCRQMARFGPAQLLMMDRDESALHALQLSIHGRALLDSPDVILCDIRDAETVRRIMCERRPDVVFHAAALKHLPMLEQYPFEAWQTNVLGTAHVLDAAAAAGVGRFVNISTDKAANPTSVLGYSKRIGERLVAETALRGGRTYLSVRFGNVIGSRGSVLTTFADQISHGGPVTVTHPDVTRFFMTIPEAVRLVIQAAAIGSPGEALVLDMGEPVRIVDVARQLTALAGRSVQILYTGLRDGEKLHEELFGDGEADLRPIHPLVSHVQVPPLDPRRLDRPVSPTSAVDVLASLAGHARGGGTTSDMAPGVHIGTVRTADRSEPPVLVVGEQQ